MAGCILARKAGAGSSRALAGWIVIVVVEVFLAVQLVMVGGGVIAAAIVALAAVVQVALYFKGRAERTPGITP